MVTVAPTNARPSALSTALVATAVMPPSRTNGATGTSAPSENTTNDAEAATHGRAQRVASARGVPPLQTREHGAAPSGAPAARQLAQQTRMRAFLPRHGGATRLRLRVVATAVYLLQRCGRAGHEIGAHPAREPDQHARAPPRTPQVDPHAGFGELLLPERCVTLLDGREAPVELGDSDGEVVEVRGLPAGATVLAKQ